MAGENAEGVPSQSPGLGFDNPRFGKVEGPTPKELRQYTAELFQSSLFELLSQGCQSATLGSETEHLRCWI
jgi:hypothetical protein